MRSAAVGGGGGIRWANLRRVLVSLRGASLEQCVLLLLHHSSISCLVAAAAAVQLRKPVCSIRHVHKKARHRRQLGGDRRRTASEHDNDTEKHHRRRRRGGEVGPEAHRDGVSSSPEFLAPDARGGTATEDGTPTDANLETTAKQLWCGW